MRSLFIALDLPDKNSLETFLPLFGAEKPSLKIGMELFYREGPEIIKKLKGEGHEIFLDLKLHDIPNTVQRAMKNLAALEVDLVNVHAAGGSEMMEAAILGLEEGTPAGKKRPYCIAVTQLTSTSERQMNEEQLIHVPLKESVLHYASLAKRSGLDGVVCSVHEARMVTRDMGENFLTVTPGIRPAGDAGEDQKRVATPEFAREEGVSAIVVGRAITNASNPLESYQRIKRSWEGK